MNRHKAGFTLIEVLIALIVLSIGLLGLAGLQMLSLRNNHSAYLRSQATILAYDIVDRMRANRASNCAAPTAGTALAGAYETTTPSSGTVAGDDLIAWNQSLQTLLPQGQGTVSHTGTGCSTVFTILVEWNDTRDPSGALTPLSVQTRL